MFRRSAALFLAFVVSWSSLGNQLALQWADERNSEQILAASADDPGVRASTGDGQMQGDQTAQPLNAALLLHFNLVSLGPESSADLRYVLNDRPPPYLDGPHRPPRSGDIVA
jgi:hypothetical protein